LGNPAALALLTQPTQQFSKVANLCESELRRRNGTVVVVNDSDEDRRFLAGVREKRYLEIVATNGLEFFGLYGQQRVPPGSACTHTMLVLASRVNGHQPGPRRRSPTSAVC
jgi:hypothetical protein